MLPWASVNEINHVTIWQLEDWPPTHQEWELSGDRCHHPPHFTSVEEESIERIDAKRADLLKTRCFSFQLWIQKYTSRRLVHQQSSRALDTKCVRLLLTGSVNVFGALACIVYSVCHWHCVRHLLTGGVTVQSEGVSLKESTRYRLLLTKCARLLLTGGVKELSEWVSSK